MNVDDRSNDAIEAYLGQLLVSLPGSPRRVRHTVAEIEAHPYDAARRARHDGLDDAAAGTAAVASIGPIAGITERQRPRLWPTPARRWRSIDVARALPPGGEEVAGAVVAGLVTVFLAFRARRVRERPLMSKAG